MALVLIGAANQPAAGVSPARQEQTSPEAEVLRPVVGDQAPLLGGRVQWLEQGPIDEFEPGRVYVLDLWATWCVSCIARMPHLSELAEKYADQGLTVVGVAVMQAEATVTPTRFLGMREGIMSYPVAEEIVEGEIPKHFQPPPGGFVPFLVIVDRAGRLAWMSSPNDPFEGFEETLGEVLAGTYDLEAATIVDRRRRDLEMAAMPLETRAQEALRLGDAAGLNAVIQELGQLDGRLVGTWSTRLFQLQREDDPVAALASARNAVDGVLSQHASGLLDLARALVRESSPEARTLAVAAATRADDLKNGADADFAWALAGVQYSAGDPADAADTMRRALEIAERMKWDGSVVAAMRRDAARFGRDQD